MDHTSFYKSIKKQLARDVSLSMVVTTAVKQKRTPAEMEQLARHMTHASKTQRRYYNFSSNIENSREIVDLISSAPTPSSSKPRPTATSRPGLPSQKDVYKTMYIKHDVCCVYKYIICLNKYVYEMSFVYICIYVLIINYGVHTEQGSRSRILGAI